MEVIAINSFFLRRLSDKTFAIFGMFSVNTVCQLFSGSVFRQYCRYNSKINKLSFLGNLVKIKEWKRSIFPHFVFYRALQFHHLKFKQTIV